MRFLLIYFYPAIFRMVYDNTSFKPARPNGQDERLAAHLEAQLIRIAHGRPVRREAEGRRSHRMVLPVFVPGAQ
jgi:hypothetical protein